MKLSKVRQKAEFDHNWIFKNLEFCFSVCLEYTKSFLYHFKHYSKLHQLKIFDTQIKSIPTELLQKCSNLKTLIIDGNQKLTIIKTDSPAKNCLAELKITNNQALEFINPKLFSASKLVESIDFYGNSKLVLPKFVNANLKGFIVDLDQYGRYNKF